MKVKDISGNMVDIKGCYFSPAKGFNSEFYLYGILSHSSLVLKNVVLAKFGDFRIASCSCDILAEMIRGDEYRKQAIEKCVEDRAYETF